MADRYDRLAPRDLIITMRSLPRRYDEVIGPVRSDPERFARRDEHVEGGSLTGTLSEVARHLGQLEVEIAKLATQSEPLITGAALGTEPPLPSADRPMGLDAAQSTVGASADAIAATLDRASTEQWAFRAATTDGRHITLLEVAQHAARIGAEGLRRTARIAAQL